MGSRERKEGGKWGGMKGKGRERDGYRGRRRKGEGIVKGEKEE